MNAKHPHHHSRVTVSGHVPAVDGSVIDSLYGLEPVYDPATRAGAPLGAWAQIVCPHCWQPQTLDVDLSASPSQFIEDCQVCCQPMEITVAKNERGDLDRIDAERLH